MVKVIDFQSEFAQFSGDLAENLGFGRSVGQIYGFLYVNSAPVSLTDIASSLSMSKGNASINLRILESWGAVYTVPVKGSRRDHYQANMDLVNLVVRRLQEGLGKRIGLASDRLNQLETELENGDSQSISPELKNKLKEIKSLISKGEKSLQLLPKITKFLNF